jgi:hypothetical protein
MATVAKPKIASEMGASAWSVTISPFEIMAARQRFTLPVDYGTHPFLARRPPEQRRCSGKRQTGQMQQPEASPAIPRSNFL